MAIGETLAGRDAGAEPTGMYLRRVSTVATAFLCLHILCFRQPDSRALGSRIEFVF